MQQAKGSKQKALASESRLCMCASFCGMCNCDREDRCRRSVYCTRGRQNLQSYIWTSCTHTNKTHSEQVQRKVVQRSQHARIMSKGNLGTRAACEQKSGCMLLLVRLAYAQPLFACECVCACVCVCVRACVCVCVCVCAL